MAHAAKLNKHPTIALSQCGLLLGLCRISSHRPSPDVRDVLGGQPSGERGWKKLSNVSQSLSCMKNTHFGMSWTKTRFCVWDLPTLRNSNYMNKKKKRKKLFYIFYSSLHTIGIPIVFQATWVFWLNNNFEQIELSCWRVGGTSSRVAWKAYSAIVDWPRVATMVTWYCVFPVPLLACHLSSCLLKFWFSHL